MKNYYIHDGQQHHGPFSFAELESRNVDAATPVWTEGLGDWSTAGEMPELRGLLVKAPPPFGGPRNSATPPPIEQIANSEYDQNLYQMEMEDLFGHERARRRNQFIIAGVLILAIAIIAWVIKL